MKRYVKIISVLLACIMVSGCFALTCSAETTSSVPTVMICGQGDRLYDAGGNVIYPVTVPDNYIADVTSECLPLFGEAVKSGDFTEWSEKLVGAIDYIYEDMQLDCNGEASDGSHIGDFMTDAAIYEHASWYNWNHSYPVGGFNFNYDWRLDPFYIAEQLNHHIEVVKAATGASKVNLIGRCEGNAILVTYLSVYGYDDVKSVCLYNQTLGGSEPISAAMSGNVSFDADKLVKYYNNADLTIDDPVIADFLDSTIGFMQSTYGLEVACAMLKPFAREMYSKAVFECVLHSYGTFPGIWTLIMPDDYDDAVEGIFAGKEDEYAGLIEKLDRYHNEIALHYEDILKDAENNGVNVMLVCKYGDFDLIPVAADNNVINDGTVSVANSSMGATVSAYGETLSSSYIAKAEANGTDKYIAADKMIDASTCLFRDTTWFVCNSEHKCQPNSVYDMIMTFFNSDGTMTIDTYEQYPQFLYCSSYTDENATIVPLTEENCMQPQKSTVHTKTNVKETVLAFLKSLVSMILKLINKFFPTVLPQS